MAADLNVYGAAKLDAVARRLKETDNRALRKELYRGIARAGKPLKAAVRKGALEALPKRGGLNAFVAKSRTNLKPLAGKGDAVVRLTTAKKGSDLRAINRGRLRHPVFGNRKVWVTQTVPARWFEKSVESQVDEVRKEVVKVIDDVAEKVARGGR